MRNLFKHIIGLMILLCSFSGLKAQEFNAWLDTTDLLIGDHIGLNLELIAPKGSMVQWPVPGDSIGPYIEAVRLEKLDTLSNQDNSLVMKQKWIVTSFDSGYVAVPPIPVMLKMSTDTSFDTLFTEALLLNVHEIEVDTSKAFQDIIGPISEPVTLREILNIALIVIGILLLAGLFVYLFIRRKKKKPLLPILRPRDPAHIIALRALDALRKKKLWQNGQLKEYYSDLTDIARSYIEDSFKINAIEMTSNEILDHMRKHEITTSLHDDLRIVLQRADLVKFAKAQPLPNEHEQSFSFIHNFIKETMPKPENGQQNKKK